MTQAKVWGDERGRAYAVVLKLNRWPVTSGDLGPLFDQARGMGLTVDARHKLIVYGMRCTVADDGPGSTWRFEQCTWVQLRQILAAHRVVATSEPNSDRATRAI